MNEIVFVKPEPLLQLLGGLGDPEVCTQPREEGVSRWQERTVQAEGLARVTTAQRGRTSPFLLNHWVLVEGNERPSPSQASVSLYIKWAPQSSIPLGCCWGGLLNKMFYE